MHSQQKAYQNAKQTYDAARSQVDAEMKPFEAMIDDGRIDEFVNREVAAEDRHQIMEKLHAVWDAKKELLSWGREMAIKFSRSDRERKTITELFDKLPGHPEFWDKAVDICMRLK